MGEQVCVCRMGAFTKKLRPRLAPRLTLAVTLDRAKSAALAFDRVYAGSDANIPGEITPGFSWFGKAMPAAKDPSIRVSMRRKDGTFDPSAIKTAPTRETLQRQMRTEKDSLFVFINREGYQPVEFLDTVEQTYKPGDDRYIFGVLEGLVGIDEESLNWAQVREFRKDGEAFLAYRNMVQWFNEKCKGMGQRQAEDYLYSACETGRTALNKHGILPTIGAVSTVLAPAVAGWLAASVWAAGVVLAAAGGVTFGVRFAEARLQRKETRLQGPLAYVQKLQGLEQIRLNVAAETRAALAAGRDMIPDQFLGT